MIRDRDGPDPLTPALLAWWLEAPVELVEALLALAGTVPSNPSTADLDGAMRRATDWVWPATSTGQEPTAPELDVGIPRRLGSYELLREIGRGGMGRVFQARHVDLRSDCAVKVLQLGPDRIAHAAERFRREASVLARLGKHPHLVTVHDFGQQGTISYYAMERVEGRSLREVLGEGELPARASVRMIGKVARALDFAHRRGLVHRDMKPENILVDAESEPRVTDFGLVRDSNASMHLTRTGQMLGTPRYMSPEQAEGVVGTVDRRADIYALGTILYEMLTRHFVHPGKSIPEILAHILRGAILSPRDLDPAIDRDLEAIVLHCLARDPDARYVSAEALAADLDRWLAGDPVAARPLSARGRLARHVVRRKRLAIACAAAAGVLVLAAIVLHLAFAPGPFVGETAGGDPAGPAREVSRDPIGERPPSVPRAAPMGRDEPGTAPPPDETAPPVEAVLPAPDPEALETFAYPSLDDSWREGWEADWDVSGLEGRPVGRCTYSESRRIESCGSAIVTWSRRLEGAFSMQVAVEPCRPYGCIGVAIAHEPSGRTWWSTLSYPPVEVSEWATDSVAQFRLALQDVLSGRSPSALPMNPRRLEIDVRDGQLSFSIDGESYGVVAVERGGLFRLSLLSIPFADEMVGQPMAIWTSVRIATLRSR